MSKTCFKCHNEKPLSEFYKHSQMKDGHVNKCKECNKLDVSEYRIKNIDSIRAYDRSRGNRHSPEYIREYNKKYPMKYKAKNMINNAIRDGKLFREPCEECGISNSHGHHDDYSKPLNVRWLCAAHHQKWHAANGEGLNPFQPVV